MKKLILTLFITVVGLNAIYSQNDIGPALSTQLFSRINFNPAGIGNNADINIFNMNRMQWAGFDGGPTYSILNIHYFNEGIKSGFGGVFSYDKLGIANTAVNAKLAYCYSVDLSEKSLISFGASAGILQKGNNFSTGSGHIYTPEAGLPDAESKMNPDFDFGLEYSTKSLLIGASINHLGMMDPATSLTPTQAYYGYMRLMFPITKEVTLTPSLLYMNCGLTNVIDINAVAFINKVYYGGLSFRVGAGMAAMFGMEYKAFRFGYSYELSFGPTTINSNTHELMLSMKISTDKKPAATNAKGKGKKKKK